MDISIVRHSLAHILAYAIQEVYPGTKFGIGPVIENGFYYDFEFPKGSKLTIDGLPKIEKKMREIIKQDLEFEKKVVLKQEAKKIFKNQPYKLELIKEIPEEKVSIYQSGNFIDLCKGPHIKSTKEIDSDAFKLTKIAGAYWRGDEKNPMLTRIYGVAFKTRNDLKQYLEMQTEAKKRDHRKLGLQLDLFCFSDLVGPGLPLFTPKGALIKEELQKKVEKICRNYGFQKVMTPHFAKIKLYELSGHVQKFSEELFHVSSACKHKFVMRPVLCPHHAQIYASKPRSYRDLPIRYMESDKMYRAEKPGEVGGLSRVYAITVEDGHSFCSINQVKDEVKGIVNIIKEFYSSLGLWGSHWVSLSVRDYKRLDKYIGDKKDWDLCEKILQEVSDKMNLKAKKCEGEAAIYGPKLDFIFKDAMGKEIQIPTVQIDFATPKRFKLSYIDEKGNKHYPVMVHRAILGSYERFITLLLEHFAGSFPLWLSPIQVQIIPIGIKHKKYAEQIFKKLTEAGIRCELKDENKTLSKKIREGEIQKIPYLLVVGNKEMESKTVNVREREKGDIGKMKLTRFLEKIKMEIKKEK